MYAQVKKILFRFSPETAHHLAMAACSTLRSVPGGQASLKRLFCLQDPGLERNLFGLTFPNPVGLAAGFDKDARWVDTLECLGFGFVEIGTVTPLPQPGNDRPRLFRLPEDEALINRMGFNNQGAAAAAARLSRRKGKAIIGGNIGKNKTTPNVQAAADYERCFQALYPDVDYFVVNVSSPNTPGLRSLQEKEPLRALLLQLQNLNSRQPVPKPLLLKIAPDLTLPEIDDIISISHETGLAGIVATNTTISREGLQTSAARVESMGPGGLSGRPLRQRSTGLIRYIYGQTAGTLPIIAAGGVFTAADALEKLEAGASLVQVYTGFIYEGPAIARNICRGILSSGPEKDTDRR